LIDLRTKKAAFVEKLANAASSIYWIAIRKRKQENSNKKVGAIPKMGIPTQVPEGRQIIAPDVSPG
jgi:hypothetical protein